MHQALPEVSYFSAIEQNPSRDGHHIHALWDSQEAPRKATHRSWLERYGRNRIEPCRGLGDVEGYCAKYVCKEGAWWWYQLSRKAWVACPLVRRTPEDFALSSQSTFASVALTTEREPVLETAAGFATD